MLVVSLTLGASRPNVLSTEADEAARVVAGRLVVVGHGEREGARAVGHKTAEHQSAIDIAEPLQARGIILVAAEAIARQRPDLEAGELEYAEADVVGTFDLHEAAALAEPGRRHERKADGPV